MNLSRVRVRGPLAAAIVMLFFGVGAAWAQTVVGSVVGAGGQAAIERGGQRYPLAIGAPVYLGDTVEVSADGKAKLRMSDGSILSLAPATTMRIDNYLVDGSGRRQAARLSVGEGVLRSVTAPVDRPASFEVDTAVGTAAVRSTDWFVNMASGVEQVAVLSGSVVLASRATGHAVTIPPGSASRLYPGRDPEPPHPLNPAEFSGLIARTESGAAGAPPAGGYYPPAPPPPGGGYYPPGGVYPGGGVIVIPGGGDRGTGGRQR